MLVKIVTIILAVIVYLIIGAVYVRVARRFDMLPKTYSSEYGQEMEEDTAVFVVLWPYYLLWEIVLLVFYLLIKILDGLGGKPK